MRMIPILAAAALAGGCTMNSQPLEASPEEDAQLSAELRDFDEAGPAVACVSTRDIRGNRSAGNALIFNGPGGLVWVNRAGCPSLRAGRALQTRTFSTRMCSGDIANVFDPQTGQEFGSCGLARFEPYRRR